MQRTFGRPASDEGREAREIRVYDTLDRLGVSYWRVDHEPAETMEICAAIDGVLGAKICKNLFLCNRQGTAFYLLLMPGDKPFKTKELSAQINSSRLSFASDEKLMEYLDVRPGAVSVLGLLNDRDHAVKLLVDEDVLREKYIGCHPCVNTSSLCIRIRDLIGRILLPTGHTMQVVQLGEKKREEPSLYPMKLTGIVRSPIWGGVRLPLEWKKGTDCETVGESWELTVRDDGESRVENGEFAGMLLRDVLRAHRDEVFGESTGDADAFPLLIKLIDAADRLSVQVHPDDAYAERVENDRGKTEMWYIVEADEGAEIICGLCEGVSAQAFAEAVAEGRVESVLRHIPVHAGECYFIPACVPHAIGKGILIAEIQQNCDLTYRVYDYDRRDKNGNLRELHVKKALDVIRPLGGFEIARLRYARAPFQPTDDILADCDYFRVVRISLDGGERELYASKRMRHLFPLSGEATLAYAGGSLSLSRGEGVLLPASVGALTLTGTGTYLLTEAY